LKAKPRFGNGDETGAGDGRNSGSARPSSLTSALACATNPFSSTALIRERKGANGKQWP